MNTFEKKLHTTQQELEKPRIERANCKFCFHKSGSLSQQGTSKRTLEGELQAKVDFSRSYSSGSSPTKKNLRKAKIPISERQHAQKSEIRSIFELNEKITRFDYRYIRSTVLKIRIK
jgi:hypothetical protein